jgi:hypothetical protein
MSVSSRSELRLVRNRRNPRLQPKTALLRFPPVHGADLKGQLRVEGGRSGRREEDSFRADRRLIPRELVIAALGGLTGARDEEQSGKMSQIAAAYQSTQKGLFSCAVCSFFIRPRSCKVVSDDISPTGWCKFFDLPD